MLCHLSLTHYFIITSFGMSINISVSCIFCSILDMVVIYKIIWTLLAQMLNISLYRQICDCSKPSVVVFCRRCFSGIRQMASLQSGSFVHAALGLLWEMIFVSLSIITHQ